MLSVTHAPSASPFISEGSSSTQLPAAVRKGKKAFISLEQFEKLQKINEPATSALALASFEPEIPAVRPHPGHFNPKYNGRINSRYSGAQYICINHVRDAILFSQKTVSDFNPGETCDYPIDMLVDALFVEFKKDLAFTNEGCLDLVDNGDGTFTSLDNRRLLIAKKIGQIDRRFGIWIRVHPANQKLTKGLAKRFLGAKTWGEAAAIRVNCEKFKGYKQNPTIMDEHKRKDPQTLQLDIRELDLSALDPQDLVAINAKAKNGLVTI